MIDNVISELKGFRDNVQLEFEHWLNFPVKLGEEVNIVPSVPRLAKSRRRFRPNVKKMVLYHIVREAWLFHSSMI